MHGVRNIKREKHKSFHRVAPFCVYIKSVIYRFDHQMLRAVVLGLVGCRLKH